RVMLSQGSGSIVNVSSTYGRAGAPGAALYVASKHALEGFTKAAALEFAETGVRINVVVERRSPAGRPIVPAEGNSRQTCQNACCCRPICCRISAPPGA